MPVSSRCASALAAVLFALLPALASAQSTPPPDRATGAFGAALGAARGGDWARAATLAGRAGPLAETFVTWQRLRTGEGTWAEYPAFIVSHGDWPGLDWLMRQGEASLEAAPTGAALDYFAQYRPATSQGAMALIAALEAEGRTEDARAEALRLWQRADLSADIQARLLGRYATLLAPHHEARLDMLLWRGQTDQAERMLPLVGNGWQRLAEARMALHTRSPGVDARIAAVPAALADHPGLAYARFDWRMRAGNHDGAAEILAAHSGTAQNLGQPEAWARWRVFLVRRALSENRHSEAYELAASHHLEDGVHYADLEWLAGYIALRHLDDPRRALQHFRALRIRVGSPISLGRAGYWEGRAHEALGEAEAARTAYAFAAEHQTSYYGLLAAERAGMPMDPALAGTEHFPPLQDTRLARSDLLQVAELLLRTGEWHEARRFILHLAQQGLTAEELGALADHMLALDEPNFAVNIAKIAAQDGLVLHRAGFPLAAGLERADYPVPPELVLAIARRESEFDPAVISPANARGLLQLLPGTGEMMARRLGIEGFSAASLTTDPALNARLGAEYLGQLIEEFGPALSLVTAGYNAGPGRPRQWLESLGDPRRGDMDLIDWVESVPFAETRNYIMRVAESLMVYRARLAGGPVPLDLSARLRGS